MGLVIKITDTQRPWPGGVIPYEFQGTWAKDHMDIVFEAMREWQVRSGDLIHFCWRKMAGPVDVWIAIASPTHSHCAIGFNPTSRDPIGCDITTAGKSDEQIYATALHELGHCIGLGHEQLRLDTPKKVLVKIASRMADKPMSKDISALLDPGVKKSANEEKQRLNQLETDQIGATRKFRQFGDFDGHSVMLYGSDNRAISDGDVAAVKELYSGS